MTSERFMSFVPFMLFLFLLLGKPAIRRSPFEDHRCTAGVPLARCLQNIAPDLLRDPACLPPERSMLPAREP